MEEGNLKASYIYNDMGQRTRKTIYQADGTTVDSVTIYHYDQMGMLVTETTETGVLMKDYVWNGGVIAAQITAMDGGNAGNAGAVTSEAIIYLYTDHLMTNRLATDETQQVVWRWEGEAFGNTPVQELGGVSVNLRFPGQYYDGETNLHYNYYRYYDPQLGRYITSDPIGLVAGLNTYNYVNSNPIGFYDPLGLARWDKWYGHAEKKFQHWYHRTQKKRGDPNIPDKETADQLKEQWIKEGKPGPDKKRNQRGYADLEILDLLIPWYLLPIPMGCAELDCDHNGIPDHEEETNDECIN